MTLPLTWEQPNTLIIHKDKVVVDEPVDHRARQDEWQSAGHRSRGDADARKDPRNIKTIRPLKEGVIADFHAAEMMIRGMIKMIDTG
ncbi:MAG: rod shape-determining protein [Bacteroidota bacterium]